MNFALPSSTALATSALFAVSLGVTAAETKPTVVQVGRIDFGVFTQSPQRQSEFRPTNVIPLVVDQSYGWVAEVKTRMECVKVREELTLPNEPKTWGDPDPQLKQSISRDGRTATTEACLKPINGVIAQSWSVAPGDPRGAYIVRVWIEDQAPRVFRFEAR